MGEEAGGGQGVAQQVVEASVASDAFTTPLRQKRRHESQLDNAHIDELKQRSTEKLRMAWESIYHKFEDAHLEAQDEIYLGSRSVKGDRMRVIIDRGHLRSISRKTLEFGCFHIDEAEVIGSGEEISHEVSASPSPRRAPSMKSNRFDESDLSDFLKAEAQRKALHPFDNEDETKDAKEPPRSAKKAKVKSQPLSGCSGAGACSKSLCFLCGGTGLKELAADD